MTNQSLLDALASYVPPLLLRRLASKPTPALVPFEDRFPAAVLFADITGFTALTDRFVEIGPAGAEELADLLNTYFGRLIDQVTEMGGEVVKFAGDALLAIWPAKNKDEIQARAQQASQCGLNIQKELHAFQATEDISLFLRLAIDVGEIGIKSVGGIFKRWELLVTGNPLIRASTLTQISASGDVALTPETWELIRPFGRGKPINNEYVLLEGIDAVTQPTYIETPKITEEMEVGIRAFIPGAIIYRITAGHSGWLAELRRVTVLFIHLPDIHHQTPLSHIQTVMQSLQKALYRYEGSINKLNVDEKGTALIAALGLPPLAHENDAVRGIQAAQDMQKALEGLQSHGSIGVATGQAFCGTVGINTRREYTMVGDVVNLAARLMQSAKDGILCDHNTFHDARDRIAFTALPPITVKGKPEAVAIYRPSGEVERDRLPTTTLIGRKAEHTFLADQLQSLLRGGDTQTVLIEGEAGIGKSRLIMDLLDQAQSLDITRLMGTGDAIEKTTPYHPWRDIFTYLFELDLLTETSPERRRTTPDTDLNLLQMTPLLNVVTSFEMPENELTRQMSGQVRAENTRRLLLRLLQAAAQMKPLLIVLEDAHWLDAASWDLAFMASKEVQPALLVFALRPFPEDPPEEYQALLKAPTTHRLTLETLPPEDSLDLVCQRLGVTTLPQPVADLIRNKAEGHPFFSEELGYALRDAGILQFENGKCRLAPHIQSVDEIVFPDTIQGLITSRIDRLQPEQQLTLKVASVIGRVFPFTALHDVHPIPDDRPMIPRHLEMLEKRQITLLSSREPELTYLFKHIITQEATYNLMAFTQRRQLHSAVAAWYERNHVHDIETYFHVLAHHWSKAEVHNKAVDFMVKAGEQALRNGAYKDSRNFFSQALSLANQEGLRLSPLVRSQWERLLGETYLGLGQMPEGQTHLQTAVNYLNKPAPTTQTKLLFTILRQTIRQIYHLIRPIPKRIPSKEIRDWYLEIARDYALLGETYYMNNEALPSIHAALQMLNSAEKAGPSAELARAYAGMTVVAGLVPFHGLAARYSRRARELTEQVVDLDTTILILQRTSIYEVGIAQCKTAEKHLLEAAELARRLGDHRRRGECLSVAAMAAYFLGEYNRSLRHYHEVYESSLENENPLHQTWALDGQALDYIRLGDMVKALTVLQEAEPLLASSRDQAQELVHLGAEAIAYLRLGQHEKARVTTNRLHQLVARSMPTLYSTQEGYAAPAEVYLTLSELAGTEEDRRILMNLARQAVQAIQSYARVFPLGKPRACLWKGQFAHLCEKHSKARKAWEKGLSFARKLHMPYEEALIHYHIGRNSQGEKRQLHLQNAEKLFHQLNAAYDLQRTRKAIGL
ncbi:MAG: adenylate/guanylate cyclase domain-containing protein [Chloroflexota bacterium]